MTECSALDWAWKSASSLRESSMGTVVEELSLFLLQLLVGGSKERLDALLARGCGEKVGDDGWW